MRDDLCIYLNPSDRAFSVKLLRIATHRAVMWRADIVLAAAHGLGTVAIMRRTGKSKPCVWRWQEYHRGRCCGAAARQDAAIPQEAAPGGGEAEESADFLQKFTQTLLLGNVLTQSSVMAKGRRIGRLS
jgi:hypothetical protein